MQSKEEMDSADQLNEILQRIQEGLRTQDLSKAEVKIIANRFGHNWFEELGYDKLKPNREPVFSDET